MGILMEIINKVKEFFIISPREAARLWYAENRDRLNQVRRIYSAKNADKLKAYNQYWHKVHRAEVQKRKRIWYANHRNEMLEYARQWRNDNPDLCKKHYHTQYLNKKAKAEGDENETPLGFQSKGCK